MSLDSIPSWQRIVVYLVLLLTMPMLGSCTASLPAGQVAPPLPPTAYFPSPTQTPVVTPRPRPSPTPVAAGGPVTVGLAANLPEEYSAPLLAALGQVAEVQAADGLFPVVLLDQVDNAAVQISLQPLRLAQTPLVERFYAAVVPFDTVQDDIALEDLQLAWQGSGGPPVLVTEMARELLVPVLGSSAAQVVDADTFVEQLEQTPGAVGIVAFDQLDPRLKALTIDGVSVLDNQLDPAGYPLALAVSLEGVAGPLLLPDLSGVLGQATNRDASHLTTLIMTGVTAISRGTAAAIERNDLLYPAAIISSTLRAADITHVSNEVPFLDDCVVNNTLNNLILCSHTDYWATLEAIGTDIVGLSGNHVNDFGREGARRSLKFYRDNKIPIYGSGLDVEEACAPLLWEHNGNRFAFLAVLAFGPEGAWATEEEPGACHYYDHKESVLETVENLAAEVDVMSVELQYTEDYNASPLAQQVVEFRELRAAGADLVTGVQSHVPQAIEPYGPPAPGIIIYGLGNLFFDQMWSWPTRTELIARHTIYEGRLLSSEILTAVLEDFAQPRWATDEERREILNRIFAAAPARPD